MSHGIMGKDVAPFAVWLGEWDGLGDDELGEVVRKLVDPTDAMDGDGDAEPEELRGWTYKGEEYCGNKKKVYGQTWTMNQHEVCLVNVSQYNNVGVYEIETVAENRESLEVFLQTFKDVFPSAQPIEEGAVIITWG